MRTMLTQIEQIFLVADVFGQATGRSRGRVSDMVFGRGGKLQAIADGADVGSRRLEKAMHWFSENWPEGVAWPADVPRPSFDAAEMADPLAGTRELQLAGVPGKGAQRPTAAQAKTEAVQ